MKKLYYLILLISFTSFSQFVKVDTKEPIRVNEIREQGKLVAYAEVYEDWAEMFFYEKVSGSLISFGLTTQEFNQFKYILLDYKVKDKDFYILDIKRGRLHIRFTESFGYAQSIIYMSVGGETYYFYTLNRNQYSRLFS